MKKMDILEKCIQSRLSTTADFGKVHGTLSGLSQIKAVRSNHIFSLLQIGIPAY